MAKKRGTAVERLRNLQKEQKYLTRREFLNDTGYFAKIAGMGTLYGAVGNIAGRIADNVIKAYETTRDAVYKVEEGLKPGRVIDKVLGRKPTPAPKPQPKVSRRGFIDSLINVAYHHPVGSGTVLGAGYGSGKQAFRGYNKYMDQVRRLEERRERVTDREERLHLEGVIGELRGEIKRLSSLEGKIGETEEKILIGIGSVGLIASIILSASSITGFTTINSIVPKEGIMAAVIFFISLLFIKVGLMRPKN